MKRFYKIFLCFFLFTFSFSLLSAQQNIVDSLYQALKAEKEDTQKLHTLNLLSDKLETVGKYNASDSVARIQLKLAETLDDKKGIASAYGNIGYVYYDRGNYNEALKAQQQALAINLQIGYKSGIAADYGSIGIIYQDRGNYAEALKAQLEALKIDEEIKNKAGLCADYGDIGIIYENMGNTAEALKAQQEALKLDEEMNNKQGIASDYNNIGTIYETMHDYPKALMAQMQALKKCEEVGDRLGMASAYGNIGNIYRFQGNLNESLKNELKSFELKKELGNKSGLCNTYREIGCVYLDQKKYGLAERYLDSALAISKAMGNKRVTHEAYFSKSVLDSINGNYKAAFDDYKNYVIFSDSLSNEASTKKIVQEQMQYEFDKKQAEEKAEQDKKDAINAANKKRQSIITGSVSIVLLLVLAFSALLFSRFRITQKQKRVIENQKVVVEEKNKEILDSITYAKRLQDAILPPMSVIEKHFPESFVLYKPKDIVAGDFYWLEQSEDKIMVAAADCTGHGVPGAMVSVVCSNALNRAVKEFNITEPGKILDKTRELVLETFEKSEGNIQDGMDISLVSLNPSKGEIQLQWSGAYNSLWFMQNGEMKEVEGNKQPIGKTDNPIPFTTHSLSLSRSTLYLFTDGYADQFGGPKGKKFKYQQLKQLIMANAQLTMAEQKEVLEKTLQEWKGSLEQVDDILIIGIKV